MRRIVEETKANGTKQWRVLTNRHIFGLFKDKWYTDKIISYCYDMEFKEDAVFDSLEKAETFVYGHPKSEEIVSRKIVD